MRELERLGKLLILVKVMKVSASVLWFHFLFPFSKASWLSDMAMWASVQPAACWKRTYTSSMSNKILSLPYTTCCKHDSHNKSSDVRAKKQYSYPKSFQQAAQVEQLVLRSSSWHETFTSGTYTIQVSVSHNQPMHLAASHHRSMGVSPDTELNKKPSP